MRQNVPGQPDSGCQAGQIAAKSISDLLWEAPQPNLTLWQSQAPSVPVLFNRGMASLFRNGLREARTCLNQAVTQIPETSSWHHLGRLYLALTEVGG